MNGPHWWVSVKDWKRDYFTTYQSQHAIVLGFFRFVSEGEEGYYIFLEAGGYYYGGPKDYEPME